MLASRSIQENDRHAELRTIIRLIEVRVLNHRFIKIVIQYTRQHRQRIDALVGSSFEKDISMDDVLKAFISGGS